MNLRLVIDSGKNFKRKSSGMWLKTLDNGTIVTVEAMLTYHMGADDILADDWEIEEDKPTSLELSDNFGGDGSISLVNNASFGTYIVTTEFGVQMTEKDVDKILTFLYNNTEIGKSRITPF